MISVEVFHFIAVNICCSVDGVYLLIAPDLPGQVENTIQREVLVIDLTHDYTYIAFIPGSDITGCPYTVL